MKFLTYKYFLLRKVTEVKGSTFSKILSPTDWKLYFPLSSLKSMAQLYLSIEI